MPNVGFATMDVIPSLKGMEGALSSALGNVKGVTEKAGQDAGAGFSGGLGGAVKALAPAALVVGVGAGLFQIGQSFEEAYSKIRVQTGATGKTLEGLKGDFKAVISTVPADFGQAADAVGFLNARLGITGEPLQHLAERFTELSRITGTDLKTNLADVTRVFGDWGIATEAQAPAMDKLFRASQTTGVGINELSQTIVFFGAPLRQLGFSFDESVTLISKWSKEGVNIQTVMAGMRKSMAGLADPTAQVQKKLQEFPGLFKEFMAAPDIATRFSLIKDEILKLFQTGDPQDKLKATSLALQIFGRRAGADMVAAFGEGRFAYGNLMDRIVNGKDTILSAGKDTQHFSETWKLFQNQMAVALEPLATTVFDQITEAMKHVGPLVSDFGKFLHDNTWAAQILAGVLGVGLVLALIAATAAFVGFIAAEIAALAIPLAIAAGIAILVAGVVLLWNNWNKIWGWMAAHPALGIILAIVGTILTGGLLPLIVGIIAVAKNWDTIWSGIQGVVSRVVAFIQGVVAAFTAVFNAIWSRWGNQITAVAQAAWALLSQMIQTAIAIVSGIISAFAALFTGNWTALWNAVKQIVGAVWDLIVAQVQFALTFIVAAVQIFIGLFSDLWSAAWNLALALLQGAWDAITGAVSAGISAVVGFVSGLPGQIMGLLGALPGLLLDAGNAAFNAWLNGMQTVWGTIIGWLGGLGQAILGAIGDLGQLLVKAGEAIMNGFLDGLKSGFDKVKDFVGGIGSWISDHKGPASVDAVLLRPAGQLIMGGLSLGLAEGWATVAQQVAGYSVQLGTTLAPAVPRFAVTASQTSQVRPTATSGLPQQLVPGPTVVFNGDIYDGEKFEQRVGRVFGTQMSEHDRAVYEAAKRKGA